MSDGYFEAAGIPLRLGREFTERDRASSQRVVVINETLARTLWPGQNPLGQVITTDGGRAVVGVVADVRHAAREVLTTSLHQRPTFRSPFKTCYPKIPPRRPFSRETLPIADAGEWVTPADVFGPQLREAAPAFGIP